MKLIDMNGFRCGSLTVTGMSDKTCERGARKWYCLCECGNKTEVSGVHLRQGVVRSCGCCKGNRLRPYESLYHSLLIGAKSGKRNIEVGLTYEEFAEFTSEIRCHYCHIPLEWRKFSVKEGYKLDRKNNDIGYLKANLAVCCKRCNRGKGDQFTYAEWYEMTECFRRKVDHGNRSSQYKSL